MFKKKWLFLGFFVFLCSRAFSYEYANYLYLYGGVNDVFREHHKAGELGIESKFHYHWWIIHPHVGAMVTFKGSSFFYAGIGLDFLIKKNFLLTLHFSPGIYFRGGGKNLGYPLEFRTGVDLGWQFENLYRLGIRFYHISNASLGSRNPGEESLVLFLGVPLKTFYGK